MNQASQGETFFPHKLDAAGLAVLLRSEVARRCGAGQQEEQGDELGGAGEASGRAEGPLLCEQTFEEAERQGLDGRHSDGGVASLGPFRPLARGFLYLARTITNPQRRWNRILLEVIRSLADGLHRLAGDLENLQDAFRKAETERAEQALLLRRLEERLSLMELDRLSVGRKEA